MKGPTNVLGLLLVAAGLFAYFSAGSKQSLLFGMGSGIMLLFAGTLMADAAVWVSACMAMDVSAAMSGEHTTYSRVHCTRIWPCTLPDTDLVALSHGSPDVSSPFLCRTCAFRSTV